jgi:hypothetical protein
MKTLQLALAALISISSTTALAAEGSLSGSRIECAGAGQTYLIEVGEKLPGQTLFQHEYKAVVSGYRLLLETTANAQRISTRTKAGFSVNLPLSHGISLEVQKLSYSHFPEEPVGTSGALLREGEPVMKLECAFVEGLQ